MLLTIPYQTLEVGRIHMNPFRHDAKGRSIASLSYKDTSVDIDDFILLTPVMKVIDYDSATGRLRLDFKDQRQFGVKLSTIQQYLISTIYIHRFTFFQVDYTLDAIQTMFQPLMTDDAFSVFLYPTTNVRDNNGTITHIQALKTGDTIRFPLYMHGIILMKYEHGRAQRLRIQHNVPYVWKV
jgi:hypothetical protein